MQNKFCLSKNGIARQCCISLEKENYDDIGTPLEFRQENDIRIMTSLERQCQVGKLTSKTRRCNCYFLVVVTTSEIKPNVVTTPCASWDVNNR